MLARVKQPLTMSRRRAARMSRVWGLGFRGSVSIGEDGCGCHLTQVHVCLRAEPHQVALVLHGPKFDRSNDANN